MKKYKKLNIILILLVIAAFSSTSTFAYFSDQIVDLIQTPNGSQNSLAIKNGKIQLSFSNDETNQVWRLGGTSGTVVPATGEVTEITGDKASEIKATYGPILINNTSDLTTKIDLKVLYGLKTDVGGINYKDEDINLADPFEVMTGDMDNSNFEFTSSTTTYPYDGIIHKRPGIDVQTYEDDATGTDRRLISSGFFNLLNAISNGSDPSHFIDYVNCYDLSWAYRVSLKSDYEDTSRGIYLDRDKYIAWLDGYAERQLYGSTSASHYMSNGKDWRYIQGNEPITFKYDAIEEGEKVSSAQIYIYIADIQCGMGNLSNISKYEAVSQNKYTVYLIDEDGVEYPMPELDSTVNGVLLGGPSGYIMTMNIPKRLLYLVEKNSKLSFKIDDERFGASGDGFDIDFAKLVVNNPTLSDSTARINGKITDKDGNPLSGVVVKGGDGVPSSPSSSDGSYSLTTSAGVVTLTTYHNDYISSTYTFPENVESGDSRTCDFVLESSANKADIKEKFKVKLKLESKGESESDWNEISFVEPDDIAYNSNKENGYEKLYLNGSQVETVTKQIAVEPKRNYRVTYEVIASNRDYIYENALEDFYTEFHSEVMAKVSQENNPNWDENGSSSVTDYFATYTDGKTIADSGKELTGNVSNVTEDEEVTVLINKVIDGNEVLTAQELVTKDSSYKYRFKLQPGKYKVYIKSKVHETVSSDVIDITEDNDTYTEDLSFTTLKNTIIKMEQPRNYPDANYYKFKYDSDIHNYNSSSDLTTISEGSGNDQYHFEKDDRWNIWKFNAPRSASYGVQVKIYNSSSMSSSALKYNTKPMYAFYTQNVYICPN